MLLRWRWGHATLSWHSSTLGFMIQRRNRSKPAQIPKSDPNYLVLTHRPGRPSWLNSAKKPPQQGAPLKQAAGCHHEPQECLCSLHSVLAAAEQFNPQESTGAQNQGPFAKSHSHAMPPISLPAKQLLSVFHKHVLNAGSLE